ncbi:MULTISPECIES: hypothetical protein [unclassified Afipia]|uniref:hypothetical protein n=1 Tax=unclassified Afipia TaxID=2642050 RepID=UPI0004679657|nr:MULTISPECIES: hypothetical protein [unclassified Afipia]
MNNADRWCAASIVPAELALPRGELDRFEVTRAKERLRKQLERSPIKRAAIIGGFDYALQTFDGRAPKWRPHMYLLIEASQGRIEVALKRHYPNDPDTRKAVIIKPLTWGIQSSMKTATYTFKAEFYKRAPGTDVRGNSDPEQMSLSPAERTELALLLHKQGFLGRTIRRGRHADFRELTTR